MGCGYWLGRGQLIYMIYISKVCDNDVYSSFIYATKYRIKYIYGLWLDLIEQGPCSIIYIYMYLFLSIGIFLCLYLLVHALTLSLLTRTFLDKYNLINNKILQYHNIVR